MPAIFALGVSSKDFFFFAVLVSGFIHMLQPIRARFFSISYLEFPFLRANRSDTLVLSYSVSLTKRTVVNPHLNGAFKGKQSILWGWANT